MKRHLWTDEDRQMLADRYPHEPAKDIARDLGVSASAVYSMATIIGVRKAEDYVNPGHTNLAGGKRSQFSPGNVPWNKGIAFHSGGRSAETQFKSGKSPHNTKPIGAYRICNGMLQRKISNAPGSNSMRWRGVHELVWIEHNGPVPEGHFVRFKQGLKTSALEEITIDRVELVTRRQNMKANSVHNYPQPIPQLVQLRGALQRKINRRKGNGEKRN